MHLLQNLQLGHVVTVREPIRGAFLLPLRGALVTDAPPSIDIIRTVASPTRFVALCHVESFSYVNFHY